VSDETLVERVSRRVRSEQTPKPPFDWLKLLPVALALLAGYGGYQVLSYRVERLEADFKDYRAEHKEAHRAIWQRLGQGEPR